MFGFFPHLVGKDDSFLWTKQYTHVSITNCYLYLKRKH